MNAPVSNAWQCILNLNTKATNPKAPSHRGWFSTDGGATKTKIVGWQRDGKFGPFISLKVDDRPANPEEASAF
jgi:hypothetical protein